MRILTEELLGKIRSDQVYKLLTGLPSCEDTRLVKESMAFESGLPGCTVGNALRFVAKGVYAINPVN